MRVFLAGATGVIGRRLLPRLVEAGHEVTAMTRAEDRAAGLREAGAAPVLCDAFDAARLREMVAAARPEVVINQLTDLSGMDARRLAETYARNDRVRREGGRNLADAARAAGARRLVSQSVAFFYAPEGPALKTEDDPLWREGPAPFGEATGALAALEETTTGTPGLEGIVLRFGFFYGPGTWHAPGGETWEQVRKRRFPIVGRGEGVYSYVHVDDAADATVAALERGAPGIYNVVDDEPAPMREWLPAYAEAIGAKPPRRVPAFVVRVVMGRALVAWLGGLRGASNAKARAELGWAPGYSSWREGFAELRH